MWSRVGFCIELWPCSSYIYITIRYAAGSQKRNIHTFHCNKPIDLYFLSLNFRKDSSSCKWWQIQRTNTRNESLRTCSPTWNVCFKSLSWVPREIREKQKQTCIRVRDGGRQMKKKNKTKNKPL